MHHQQSPRAQNNTSPLTAVHSLTLVILHWQPPPPLGGLDLPPLLLLLLLSLLLQHARLHLRMQLLIALDFCSQAAPMHAGKEGVLHDLVHAFVAKPLLAVIRKQATQQVFCLGVQLQEEQQLVKEEFA
jgi:uncharacterized protein YggT (Ycf19 family)